MQKIITWHKNDPTWARITVSWGSGQAFFHDIARLHNEIKKDFPEGVVAAIEVDLSRGITFTWYTWKLQRGIEYPGYTQEEGEY